MDDLEYTAALMKLVEHIQKGTNNNDAYALMLAEFNDHYDAGETNNMSVALAIEAIKETETTA